jgi:hypothetical protein
MSWICPKCETYNKEECEVCGLIKPISHISTAKNSGKARTYIKFINAIIFLLCLASLTILYLKNIKLQNKYIFLEKEMHNIYDENFIKITALKFRNKFNDTIDTVFYKQSTTYIQPVIYYRVNYPINFYKTVQVKFIFPDKPIAKNAEWHSTYSTIKFDNKSSGDENIEVLYKWGFPDVDTWKRGIYRVEVWIDNKCLSVGVFQVI